MCTGPRDECKHFSRWCAIVLMRSPGAEGHRPLGIQVGRVRPAPTIHRVNPPPTMHSVLSIGSTLAQAAILLGGAFLILAYTVSVLRQSILEGGGTNPTRWTSTLVFNLGLVGLYALFAYFWVAEEVSDRGFQALAEMLNGGV